MSLWSDSFPHCVDVHKIIMFVFWPQALWKTVLCPFFHLNVHCFQDPNKVFNGTLCFFVLRHIENWFFNESLCFLGFSTIENCFLNESLCFFGVRLIENGVFNESVCFLVSGLLKMDFLMRIFFYLASGIVEDGAVPVFSFQFKCF